MLGEKSCQVHQHLYLLGPLLGHLRDDHPAHAVSHQHDRLSLSIERLAHAFGVGRQGDLANGGPVLTMPRQVKDLHLVSCLSEQRDNLLPAPPSMPRAVDEDIPTHHLSPFSLMVTSSFTWVNVFLS